MISPSLICFCEEKKKRCTNNVAAPMLACLIPDLSFFLSYSVFPSLSFPFTRVSFSNGQKDEHRFLR